MDFNKKGVSGTMPGRLVAGHFEARAINAWVTVSRHVFKEVSCTQKTEKKKNTCSTGGNVAEGFDVVLGLCLK
jgi:hypothetical protein